MFHGKELHLFGKGLLLDFYPLLSDVNQIFPCPNAFFRMKDGAYNKSAAAP